jgi:hypothetical protein
MGSENGAKRSPSLSSSPLSSFHKSSLSRFGAFVLLLLFCVFSMTFSHAPERHTMVANLASESPEMLGLKNTKTDASRGGITRGEISTTVDEGKSIEEEEAKLSGESVDVEKIIEETVEEKENEEHATRPRATVYDPLPNQFQLNGEPFDFATLRGKVTLFSNVASH